MIEYLKKHIPFELKRDASAISILVTLFTLYILSGFFGKIGEWLFDKMGVTFKVVSPFIADFYHWVTAITFQVSLVEVVIYSILFFPIYRRFDRFILKKQRGEVVFEDDFINNQGWSLNYWGTTNPSKTNRIEHSTMIFEAKEEELLSQKKEFGAYIDLRNGIYDGLTYEVSCQVKSEPNTTMGFQLWVHDTIGGNPVVSIREPSTFCLPSSQNYQTITLRYKANSTNAIRIHLSNKGGDGRILVDKLTVTKV